MARLVRPARFAPLLLLFGAGVSAWYAVRGLPFSDEGAVLTAAARILRGAVFYRDVDAYWAPGSAYLAAFAMSLLGEHLSVARGLAAAFYCLTLISLYAASLRLLDRPRAALFGLSLLCFKFVGWPAFSVYIYSDVAFAFACAGIALLLSALETREPGRLALAGLCIGLALVSKQNLGIYLALAGAGLLWRAGPRALGIFATAAAVPVVVMSVFFAAHGVFGQMIASGLLRPLTGYLPTSGIAFAPMLAWWELGSLHGMSAAPYLPLDYFRMAMEGRLPGGSLASFWWLAGEVGSRAVYTSVPVAFAWAAWRAWSGRGAPRPPRERALLAFALLALAGVASAFPRADFFHVISVFPLVLLLLFALVQPEASARGRRPWLEAIAVGSALLACAGLAVIHRSQLTHRIEVPRASVWVDPSEAWVQPLVEVVSAEISEGERLFVYGHESHFYFLTGRFYPWPFSQLYPGQAGGDGGRALARLLAEQPPRLVIQGVQKWPGVPAIPSYAPAVPRAIAAHFRRDADFFLQHPPDGGDPPLDWVVSVLRPRAAAPP